MSMCSMTSLGALASTLLHPGPASASKSVLQHVDKHFQGLLALGKEKRERKQDKRNERRKGTVKLPLPKCAHRKSRHQLQISY